MGSLSPARERILLELKTKGPQTATHLARRLRVTPVAVRQHLQALSELELIDYEDQRGKVGRPSRLWRIAPGEAAQARFPDSHQDLTLSLLEAARAAFGEAGIERLVRERLRQQLRDYRGRLADVVGLEKRVGALARLRRSEGYMAAAKRQPDGSMVLVENHCPICAAAEACQGLCRAELELFRGVLGKGVRVERVEYLLDGARRCAYRIHQSTADRLP